jgi:hypothetical protein
VNKQDLQRKEKQEKCELNEWGDERERKLACVKQMMQCSGSLFFFFPARMLIFQGMIYATFFI